MITVFSASNYYEIGSNRGKYLEKDYKVKCLVASARTHNNYCINPLQTGAYIKFGANSDRYFVQFTAAASKTKKLTFRQQVDNVEKSAIRELKEKLREQKIQLQKEFKERDSGNTGK